MMVEIENAVIVGRSFGDNLIYSVLDIVTNKTIRMIANADMDVLELGSEGMVSYTIANEVKMLGFATILEEELV